MVHVPDAAHVFDTLTDSHPRLLATADDFARVAALRQTDPLIRGWYAKIHGEAEKILTQPPSTHDIPDGRRLLAVSRRVLGRAMTLGLVWRVEHDDRFADRLWAEMHAVSQFPDWNPSHFLDTAEMTAGVAIAYDWLFDHWTDAQRAEMRDAIVRLGLLPAKAIYDKQEWWSVMHHNWNQVCNGGIALGALAICDDPDSRQLAAETIRNAVASLPLAIASYGPDGAWAEGPGYWNYATMYTTLVLSGLHTALGTDFGLSDIPGLNLAGDMPIHCTSPTGLTFNFADAHEHTSDGWALFYLARRFGNPAYARHRIHLISKGEHPEALDLLWYDPQWASATDDDASLPTARHFRGTEIAVMRSAWSDPDATFVGLKAGSNAANHSNLDLGSFILDAHGHRFAIDLGPDDYNLPHYFNFSGPRWTYYRMRAEGHNTLVLNPTDQPDQNPKAAVVISDFQHTPDRTTAAVDLTAAYADHGAQRVRRTVTLDGRVVTVSDDIQLKNPGEIWWFWHTRAQVAVSSDGRSAVLTQAGKQLTVRLLAPAGAKFTVMDAAPLPASPNPEGQNPNNGGKLLNASAFNMVAVGTVPQFGPADPKHAIRKLAVHLAGASQATITVEAQP